MQLYTVAKDGAVVVWECSFSLSEMKDYIVKVRGGPVSATRAQGSHGDEEEGEETMDTTAGRGNGAEEEEELQESENEGRWTTCFMTSHCLFK